MRKSEECSFCGGLNGFFSFHVAELLTLWHSEHVCSRVRTDAGTDRDSGADWCTQIELSERLSLPVAAVRKYYSKRMPDFKLFHFLRFFNLRIDSCFIAIRRTGVHLRVRFKDT